MLGSVACRTLATLLSAASLAACAGGDEPNDDTPGVATVVYSCENDRTFEATYNVGVAQASVVVDGQSYELPQLPSGSGIRYGDGTLELHAKGNSAQLTGAPSGDYLNCTGENR